MSNKFLFLLSDSMSIEPPHINGSEGPGEVSVIVNNPLELSCIASGIPAPKVSWMKDGRPFLQTDQVQILEGGAILRVSSAQVNVTMNMNTFSALPSYSLVHHNYWIICICASNYIPDPYSFAKGRWPL